MAQLLNRWFENSRSSCYLCYLCHLCYLWIMVAVPDRWFWSVQGHKFIMQCYLPLENSPKNKKINIIYFYSSRISMNDKIENYPLSPLSQPKPSNSRRGPKEKEIPIPSESRDPRQINSYHKARRQSHLPKIPQTSGNQHSAHATLTSK